MKTIEVEELQAVEAPPPVQEGYSIAKAAKLLKRGQSWVKENKARLLHIFRCNTSEVVYPNNSLTSYGFEMLKAMKPYLATGNLQGFTDWLYKTRPELIPDDVFEVAADQLPSTLHEPAIDAELVFTEIEDENPDWAEEGAENLSMVKVDAQVAIANDISGVLSSLANFSQYMSQQIEQTIVTSAMQGMNRGATAVQEMIAKQTPQDAAVPKVKRQKKTVAGKAS